MCHEVGRMAWDYVQLPKKMELTLKQTPHQCTNPTPRPPCNPPQMSGRSPP